MFTIDVTQHSTTIIYQGQTLHLPTAFTHELRRELDVAHHKFVTEKHLAYHADLSAQKLIE